MTDVTSRTRRRSRLRRLLPVLALGAAVAFSTGLVQGQSSDRAKQLGGKLVCMCGCAQGLIACNHVNCPVSAPMLKELDQRIALGDSDDLILQSFVQEYGTQVLAEPPTHGFNALAWAIPGIAFGLGLAVVFVVMRQWRHRGAPLPASASAAAAAISPEALERARRQIERDTED